MKNRVALILSIFSLLLFVGCSKEEIRTPNFLEELATVVKTGSTINIQLDNGTLLKPNNLSHLKLENDNRVFLNYTPLQNDSIRINRIYEIFLGQIKETDSIEGVKSDPVKVISRWVSGNYLNLSLQVDYHSRAHSAAILMDTIANKPTLYLTYSRKDDPAGAPNLTYLSFNLGDLKEKNFTLYINTYDGEHKFEYYPN